MHGGHGGHMFIQQKNTLMISKSLLFCGDIKKLHFYNRHFPENEMQSLYFLHKFLALTSHQNRNFGLLSEDRAEN